MNPFTSEKNKNKTQPQITNNQRTNYTPKINLNYFVFLFCDYTKSIYICPRKHGDLVAQSVEHLPFKERVLGSSPSQITQLKTFHFLEGFFVW